MSAVPGHAYPSLTRWCSYLTPTQWHCAAPASQPRSFAVLPPGDCMASVAAARPLPAACWPIPTTLGGEHRRYGSTMSKGGQVGSQDGPNGNVMARCGSPSPKPLRCYLSPMQRRCYYSQTRWHCAGSATGRGAWVDGMSERGYPPWARWCYPSRMQRHCYWSLMRWHCAWSAMVGGVSPRGLSPPGWWGSASGWSGTVCGPLEPSAC